MTKGLNDVFGLPSMDEILSHDEQIEEPTELAVIEPEDDALVVHALEQLSDHARAMDEVHGAVIKHAHDSAELAFDLDPARAPRMLEVAAIHYKTAMDAKNSKVDATMKMLKLVNETRKIKAEEKKINHDIGDTTPESAEILVVDDRNALLKRMREEALEELRAEPDNTSDE